MPVGPDVLEVRNGGGCLTLFGLPFLAVGLYVAAGACGLIPVKVEGGMGGRIGMLAFGLVFAGAGILLSFGRSGVTIDRQAHRVVRWHGLLVPVRRRTFLTDSFAAVRLDRSAGDSDTPESYTISLAGGSGSPLAVAAAADYQTGAAWARAVAEFLGKPLEDLSTGTRTVREAGLLDETLAGRLRRTGERVPAARPPVPSAVGTERDAGKIVLRIPSRNGGRLRIVPAAFVMVFAFVVIVAFIRPLSRLPMPPGIRWFLMGAIGLFFVVAPLVEALRMCFDRPRKTVVTVGGGLLRIDEPHGLETTTTEMAIADIRDLALPDMDAFVTATAARRRPGTAPETAPPLPGFARKLMAMAGSPGVIVRTDAASLTIGAGLSPADAAYVHAAIREAVAADPAARP